MLATLLGAALSLLVMAGLLVPLESWFPITAARPRVRATVTCVALFVFNTVLMQAVGAPVLEALEEWAAVSESPSWARWLAVLVLSDVAGYWAHRAMHRVPVLWRLHAVHHAPTELHWLEAWRQHPVDFVVHGLVVGVPGALLGVSLADVASVVLVRKVFTAFLHANVRWRFGPLEWVLATPLFHRLHHSADPRDYDSNFAGTFAWLDVLFRTHRGTEEFPSAVGLAPPVAHVVPSTSGAWTHAPAADGCARDARAHYSTTAGWCRACRRPRGSSAAQSHRRAPSESAASSSRGP